MVPPEAGGISRGLKKEMPLELMSRSVTCSTAPEAEISAGSAKG
jgi:hypothetical protein